MSRSDPVLLLAAFLLRRAAVLSPQRKGWWIYRAEVISGVARRELEYTERQNEAAAFAISVYGSVTITAGALAVVTLAIASQVLHDFFASLTAAFGFVFMASGVLIFAAYHARRWSASSGRSRSPRRWPVVVAALLGILLCFGILSSNHII